MTIEKNVHGAYVISDIVGGVFFTRQFYGYNKREAVRLFKQYVKEQR